MSHITIQSTVRRRIINSPTIIDVEVSLIRNRLRIAMEQARDRSNQRRARTAEAERTYAAFLESTAIPVARMLQNALKAEGHAFTVFTPGGGLRLASDRGRDDYIELTLDSSGPQPHVLGRIVRTRGSRTLEEERPIGRGGALGELSEEDVLSFFLEALGPWLEH
jgi:hypothetical protein